MLRHLKTRRQLLLQSGCTTGLWLCGRSAQACEVFSSTLRITHPWTRATPMGAPFALLGVRFDEVTEDEALLAVETPVAQQVVLTAAPAPFARSSGDTPVWPLHLPAGSDTVLGSGGPGATSGAAPHQAPTHQLRLLRLTQDLEVARSYPLWLTFKVGGVVKATLNVDYARFGQSGLFSLPPALPRFSPTTTPPQEPYP